MSHDEKCMIPLFDGNNFDDWRFRVETRLESLDLLDFAVKDCLNAPEVTLLATNTADEKVSKKALLKDYIKNDRKCKSEIVMKIADEYLEYVKEKSTAYEMRTALQQAFTRKGIANQLYLRKSLLLMKFNPAQEKMDKHFLRFDKAIRDLKSAGATVEEMGIVCHLLLTMPSKYDAFVIAIETSSEDKLKVDFVKNRLLDEERKRNAVDSCDVIDNNSHLLLARASGGRRFSALSNRSNQGANVADTTLNDSDPGKFSLLADPASTALPKGNEFVINCYLDSGSTEIMVNSVFLSKMTNVKELASPIRVKTAKANEILHATHTGDIKLVYIKDSIRNTICFTDILVVPELDYNLISVRRLDQKGVKFMFFNGVASAYLQEKLLFKAVASYKMYEVQFEFNQETANVAKDDDIYLWHRRLGHIGARSLKALPDLVDGIAIDKKKLDSPLNRHYCIEGKQSRLPHVKPRVRATRALQLIHSDVMGPISPTSYDSKRYVVTFIDDWSHLLLLT
ncbi:hypothetical protein ILUMI_14024 [Ignelater luminosus]|uniref:Gag-pol polyprotein n=1 Tax=Ignelater luminosus TaxID=2038154 RepID=A0A8K0CR91_IGNLU|nr:hypothetical protein ILUMI_14024 [Ignelater luminosus]